MAEQGGFRQWLANQGGTLREQFAIPRDSDGSISWGRFLGQTAAGAAFGPFGSIASRALFNPQTMQSFASGARGVGTSFGRMFDGDPRTGFGNNPTAPWNWGSGPRNVAEGHPDFMGPSQGTPQGGSSDPYGDPRNMGPPAPGSQPDRIFNAGSDQRPSGYTGNQAADRATWGDYMSRMTQNMSPSARLAFISQGGMPSSGLRGAERVMAGGSSTTAGMGSMARVWGYSPDGTGVLFNDQRQVV